MERLQAALVRHRCRFRAERATATTRLALAVAVTGILATLPYIALQLVGMAVVIRSLGIGGTGLVGELPLLIAFVILAAYTYTSGLRAPAVIALVKDTMIYMTVIVAIIVIPIKLGGFGAIFAAAQRRVRGAARRRRPDPSCSSPAVTGPTAGWRIGSALALFLYPHAVTGVLAASRGDAVRRNAILLPAYSLALGMLALFGYMAIAAHITAQSPNLAVPLLLRAMFPSWFVGFAFAAIAIGALVPAAIMSIAAANLWTRNIYRPFLRPNCTDAEEGQHAKVSSLVVKVGALAFILFLPTQYAINLQLLGGVWVLQTLPAVVARPVHAPDARRCAVLGLARRDGARNGARARRGTEVDVPDPPRRADDNGLHRGRSADRQPRRRGRC